MDTETVFGADNPVIGMVHLSALPGTPGADADRGTVREQAVADARALEGCDAVLVENFGDRPYHDDRVPAHTVAEMTAATVAVSDAVDLPHGVNVLRNDAAAAVSVAAATGGAFIRVNVHTGVRASDQGLLEGQAASTMRLRKRLGADVAVLADVAVKHSMPVAGSDDPRALAERTRETVDRGLADGVVVSGPVTGTLADDDRLRAVLDGRDDADRSVPVLVGSGVTPETAPRLLEVADGLIVGTALKQGGETAAPVDPERVADLLGALGR